MNRPLTASMLAVALLLGACTDDKPAASRPTPDDATRRGCTAVAYVVERNNVFFALNLTAGRQASGATDPKVSAGGRELLEAAQKAGELDVGSHGKADMTQAEARIGDAQQKVMMACRELLGDPPWS
ncbi:hypothetical protein [Micromonospora sp. IBHARD004]|uniref:hypothetical protein n=1 Tax=Micromonospora sp. IBHARD004 TaxID=3457764 RepID=UPI004058AA45